MVRASINGLAGRAGQGAAHDNRRMLLRWTTLAVWTLVAASAVAWGLKLLVRPAPLPPLAQAADTGPALQADLTRLLGTDPPPPMQAAAPEPAADARFTLVGVVAPRNAAAARREGVALIAVDGRPPRAFRVGSRVDGETVLQAVNARGAELGPRGGPAQIALALPPLAAAATGSLPSLAPLPTAPLPRGTPAMGALPPPQAQPIPPFARPNLAPNAQEVQNEDGNPNEPAAPRRGSNPTLM
jgi:general secretion pathway protein C